MIKKNSKSLISINTPISVGTLLWYLIFFDFPSNILMRNKKLPNTFMNWNITISETLNIHLLFTIA